MGWVGLSACMVLVERILELDQNLLKISVQFAQLIGKAGQAQVVGFYVFPQVLLV